jgi:hypothetical protein
MLTAAGTDVSELTLDRSYHLATVDHDADLLEEKVAAFATRVARA